MAPFELLSAKGTPEGLWLKELVSVGTTIKLLGIISYNICPSAAEMEGAEAACAGLR